MKRFALLSLFAAAPVLAQPDSQPVKALPMNPPSEAPASLGAPQTLKGTLTYTEIPSRVKSVEAYLGVDFRVGDQPVEASDQVSRDALMALKDKAVEVVCQLREPGKPAAIESYPINQDGSPMPRPAQCRVLSIKAQ